MSPECPSLRINKIVKFKNPKHKFASILSFLNGSQLVVRPDRMPGLLQTRIRLIAGLAKGLRSDIIEQPLQFRPIVAQLNLNLPLRLPVDSKPFEEGPDCQDKAGEAQHQSHDRRMVGVEIDVKPGLVELDDQQQRPEHQ